MILLVAFMFNLYSGILLCFFRRCRIIAGGVVIEDIDNFNRLSLMLQALKPEEDQLGIAAEGSGSFDDKYANAATDTRK